MGAAPIHVSPPLPHPMATHGEAHLRPRLGPRDLLIGLAGYAALAAVGLSTLGTGAVGTLPLAVAPPVGALLLTVPSLLAAHQFLGLGASPGQMLRVVGEVFSDSGRLALGLAPMVGLFAATSALGPAALILALTGVGVVALSIAQKRLNGLEKAARPDNLASRFRMVLLSGAWVGLCGLIAIRIGWDLVSTLYIH